MAKVDDQRWNDEGEGEMELTKCSKVAQARGEGRAGDGIAVWSSGDRKSRRGHDDIVDLHGDILDGQRGGEGGRMDRGCGRRMRRGHRGIVDLHPGDIRSRYRSGGGRGGRGRHIGLLDVHHRNLYVDGRGNDEGRGGIGGCGGFGSGILEGLKGFCNPGVDHAFVAVFERQRRKLLAELVIVPLYLEPKASLLLEVVELEPDEVGHHSHAMDHSDGSLIKLGDLGPFLEAHVVNLLEEGPFPARLPRYVLGEGSNTDRRARINHHSREAFGEANELLVILAVEVWLQDLLHQGIELQRRQSLLIQVKEGNSLRCSRCGG